jgi:hypothetical protein
MKRGSVGENQKRSAVMTTDLLEYVLAYQRIIP